MTLEKKNRPTCPICGSSNVYARIRTQEIVCRRCGEASPNNKANKNKEI
jgi:transcription initiation factor TFIIIB Brf1 subunit/transcription initiation factor TFIIB